MKKRNLTIACLIAAFAMILSFGTLSALEVPEDPVVEGIERVSESEPGVGGYGDSYTPSISSDGRYVAFDSEADLVEEDTNDGDLDVYVYDRDAATPTTTAVSVIGPGLENEGETGEYHSYNPSISADGMRVAFESYAGDLVENDTNNDFIPVLDVFVRDLDDETTVLVSGTTDDIPEAPSRAEGDWSSGNGNSQNPSISADGRYVAFDSNADNLVENDSNYERDVFVHDLDTGDTVLVSVNSEGEQAVGDESSYAPSISGDGRYVAFYSDAYNLDPVDEPDYNYNIFVHDRDANGDGDYDEQDVEGGISTVRITKSLDGTGDADGDCYDPVISEDGRYVAFYSDADNLVETDTNDGYDVFVHDLQTGETELVNVSSDEEQAEYGSDSYVTGLSSDGRYISFTSDAENLVDDDENGYTDVFVRDTVAGTTTRITADDSGNEANGNSGEKEEFCWVTCGDTGGTAISADGRYVAFNSEADNLVETDTLGYTDVFVKDFLGEGPTITRISPDEGSIEGGTQVTISGSNFVDGATVTFGDVDATGVAVASLVATTPAHDAGLVDVTVTNPDGQSVTLTDGFTYKYAITSEAGANGVIEPLGETLVAAGGSQAYTMTADSSYEVEDVLVDGVSVGAVATYTFSDVSDNHSISVTFSLREIEPTDEENVAPDAPVLTSPANEAADVSLTPTLTAGAFSDANAGDTHSQTDWQISTLADFSSLVLDASSEESLKSFAVPDLILDPSTTYYWRAAYYDDEGAASDFSEVFSFTTEADADDLDADGIPDDQEVDEPVDLDGDGVDDRDQEGFTPIKSLKPGKFIGMKLPPGLILNALKSLSEDDFTDTGLPPNILFPFGVLSFKLEGMDAGGTTEIEIFFSEALPGVPLWHKYFETLGSWGDFSDNVRFVEEGGRFYAILTLVDGGFGDLDGVANGVIVDPSGLTEVEDTGGSSSESVLPSCFIDTAGFSF
jgi:Tol biopolymer transport system component